MPHTPCHSGQNNATSAAYMLSESEYAENETKDPWVHHLVASINSVVVWLNPLLVTTSFENLVQIIVDNIVSRLEAAVLTKRFNQLGGLQLDKDVRSLVSSFNSPLKECDSLKSNETNVLEVHYTFSKIVEFKSEI